MVATLESGETLTKGQRTATRIMDVAEALFARQGYDGTSLRQIAKQAGIREPGLYNHFSGKQNLYEAVLHRALTPLTEVLSSHLDRASQLRHYTDLPAILTDLLLEYPHTAALFQQSMLGDSHSIGGPQVRDWLDRLMQQGMRNMESMGPPGEEDSATLAMNVIAIFNLTMGYFLSQRAFDSLCGGEIKSPENIARHKSLLRKVIRAMLIS